MNTCLIVDVSCLCHRAYHKLNALAFEEEPTGVLFGFFRSLQKLTTDHEQDVVSFCYDSRESKRREIYPAYKARSHDADEQARRSVLHKQIDRLPGLLGEMGYRNGYHQPGYEADDLITAICKARPQGRNIIISSDRDLYQCLNIGTWIWNGTKRVTYKSFIDKYMINPDQWWRVLALAGGHDNIPGVPGVGVETALRYIRGGLDSNSKKCRAIEAHATELRLYRQLVRLPYPGTVVRPLVADAVTDAAWDAVVGRLGMHTLKRSRRRRAKTHQT